MQRVLLVVIVAVLAVAAYLFLQQQPPQPSQTDSSPSAPVVSDKVQQEAEEHINRLTQGAEKPIAIEKADNFVTADQLLDLPAVKTATTAELVAEEVPDTPNTTSAEAGTYAVSSHLSVISTGNKTPQTNKQIEAITVQLANQIKLQELLDDPDQSAQKVYFIHAVNEGDHEGLWGIIQHGLMRTFTSGLTLPGQEKAVYVDIPKEADEKLADTRSSFLGQILKRKVDKTYIYNYEKGILGENPDLIKPGQQLIIVTFTEQELIGIYNHFVNL